MDTVVVVVVVAAEEDKQPWAHKDPVVGTAEAVVAAEASEVVGVAADAVVAAAACTLLREDCEEVGDRLVVVEVPCRVREDEGILPC